MRRAGPLIVLAGCGGAASTDPPDTPDTDDSDPISTLLVCADGAADFVTLADAVDAAPDGATIQLCAGEHVGHAVIERDVTIRGAGAGSSVLVADPVKGLIVAVGSPALTIGDLTVRAASHSVELSHDGSHVLLERIEFDGASLRVERDGSVTVSYCSFHGVDGPFLDVGGGTIELVNVEAFGNAAAANPNGSVLDLGWLGIGYGAHVTIRNSRLTGPDGHPLVSWWESGPSLTIENSVLHAGAGGTALMVQGSSEGLVVRNSLLYAPDGTALETNTSDPLANLSYSGVFAACSWGADCGWEPGGTLITADPAFVDAAGRDYHLQAGSPAIDAGDPDPTFSDRDGTRNDMGAFGGPGAPE